MSNKIIIVGVLCALIFGAGGFYGGMRYQQSQTPQRGNFSMGNIPAGQRQGATGNSRGASGGMATGEIIAKDEKSITIKLGDGGSKIIFYSTSTRVKKTIDGAATDLEIGKQVVISGSANQDGSITAQTIQMRPTE